MKIKKGDIVKVITGKDKGKTGKVLKAVPADFKVVVEGLNLIIKHRRPRKENEKGQKIQYPAPLTLAKVMLVCPHCSKAVRVAYQIGQDKIKRRICRKCKEVI
ncbi:MAG: 50S ribosomal protein L24 [Candidatus Buchananbacteria bacterium]